HRAVPGGIADLARVPRPDVRQGDVAGAGITCHPTHVLRGGVGTGEEVQQCLRVPGLRVVGDVHDLVDEQVRVLGQPHDIVRLRGVTGQRDHAVVGLDAVAVGGV